jgi:hypothetical protein
VFRYLLQNEPQVHGFRFSSIEPDENLVLYKSRFGKAVGLLDQYAPRHGQWLRRGFGYILVAKIPGTRVFTLLPDVRGLHFSPRVLWKATTEEIVMDLTAAATLGRCYSLVPARKHVTRIARLAIRERIWVARRLPGADALVQKWSAALADFDKPAKA